MENKIKHIATVLAITSIFFFTAISCGRGSGNTAAEEPNLSVKLPDELISLLQTPNVTVRLDTVAGLPAYTCPLSYNAGPPERYECIINDIVPGAYTFQLAYDTSGSGFCCDALVRLTINVNIVSGPQTIDFSTAPQDKNFDFDGDGVTNFDEFVIYGTNHKLSDTDADGMGDAWEIANIPAVDPLVDDAALDPDGDGQTNLQELAFNSDPNDSTPACADASDNDGDTLTDFPSDTSCSSAIDIRESKSLLMAGGVNHTCALTDVNGIKCSGDNGNGELGDDRSCGTQCLAPVDVFGLTSGIANVATGTDHTCAVTSTGGAKCWGQNIMYQLGDNGVCGNFCFFPVDVFGLSSGVDKISAGARHSCALTTTGGVKCWGNNDDGQLGNGGWACGANCPRPVDVMEAPLTVFSGAKAISLGGHHSCAITSTNGVKCWGRNGSGQLGDNYVCGSSCLFPVDASGLTSGVDAIDISGDVSCALLATGGVKCWGNLLGGSVPADVMEAPSTVLNGMTTITTGEKHACGITILGGVKCWGDNANGQLGDGQACGAGPCLAVDVSGLTSGVDSVYAGANHTCAILSTGMVRCWGSNANGQFGDGTTAQSLIPVDVWF